MGNQLPTSSQQAAGQPSAAPVQPEYLTREQAEALVKQAAQQATEDAFRRAQGFVVKRDQAIQKSLDDLKATLEMQRQAGVTITPEQERVMQEQVRQKAIQEAGPSDQASTQQPVQAAADDTIDPITAIAIGFERRYGVEITEEDPEFRLIKTDGAEDEYLDTYLQAIQTKQKRLQGQPPPTVRTPTNLGQGGTPPTNRDPLQYRTRLSEALRK